MNQSLNVYRVQVVRGCLFAGILRIDHLWEFTSLAKLELNNNLIEKIEGLDRLVNLTWLSKTKLCIYFVGNGQDVEKV